MTPEEIAKQRQEAESKKISAIQPADNMTSQAVALDKPSYVQTIEKVYESPINQLGLTIKGLEGRRNYIQQQDETAQRRSRNMQMIAGLSDGLASLANLIGVADRGSNINLGQGALTPLGQKVEQARLERKADIKSIDDRLEQANNQLMQMKLARGNAVAQAQQAEREKADRLAAEARERAHQTFLAKLKIDADKEATKAAHEFTANENEKNRTHQANLTDKEIQGRKDLANLNNEAEVNKYQIRYGNSGSKDTTQFVMDDPTTGQMRTINIGDKSLNNILATYLPIAVKNGEISEEQADEAKNWRSNEVSKTNLLGMVNSSKTMRNALLTAVGEVAQQEETPSAPIQVPGNSAYVYQGANEPRWSVKYNSTK